MFAETVRDAVCAPTALGTNVTLIVQLTPTAKVEGQVFVWLKSGVTAMPEMVRGKSPVLLYVKV